MEDVHFIINLYSFPLSLVPQTNPSFPRLCQLPPPKQNNFLKLPPPFLLTPLFWGYLNTQVRINKMLNSLYYQPCRSRLTPRKDPFIFVTPLGFISLRNACWIFFQTLSRTGWRKLWFALSKFGQKIWRWLGTLDFLYFVWLTIQYDGFTVL